MIFHNGKDRPLPLRLAIRVRKQRQADPARRNGIVRSFTIVNGKAYAIEAGRPIRMVADGLTYVPGVRLPAAG